MSNRFPELEVRKNLLEEYIQRLEFEIGQLEDYQIDIELLSKTLQDFRAVYNELTPEEQTRLLQLMVQEVILGTVDKPLNSEHTSTPLSMTYYKLLCFKSP